MPKRKPLKKLTKPSERSSSRNSILRSQLVAGYNPAVAHYVWRQLPSNSQLFALQRAHELYA